TAAAALEMSFGISSPSGRARDAAQPARQFPDLIDNSDPESGPQCGPAGPGFAPSVRGCPEPCRPDPSEECRAAGLPHSESERLHHAAIAQGCCVATAGSR